jgi:S1-C subfamily serine protease
VKVAGPTAGLSEDKGGSFSDPNFEGNVGGGLLKRFTVTFDYANQVMYLKPIVPPPADAGRFDRSGMWINAGKAGYDVTDVSPGGPAAEAGIAVGDIITAIDGGPVVMEGLSDARIALRARPAGTKVEIAVTRGAEKKVMTLVLRDQI